MDHIQDPIGALLRELDTFHRQIDAAALQANPRVEAELRTQQAQLREQSEVFFREFRKGKAEMESELTAMRQNAEASLAEAQRLQQAVTTPAPAVPPAPEIKDDPAELGGILQQELLQRFGDLAGPPQARDPVDEGSIARHWAESDGTEEVEAAAPPMVPQPETPAAVKPVLRPKSSRPLSRPPAEPKPKPAEPPSYDESIGKMSFEDE